MRPALHLPILLGLAACGPRVEVFIRAPEADAELVRGEPVQLHADVTVNGEHSDTVPTWEAPGWSAEGLDLTVDDLPYGSYDLVARVELGGSEATAAVPVSVALVYAGETDIDVDIDSPSTGPFSLHCGHVSLDLTLSADGELEGVGICTAYGERIFDITGLVADGVVTGEMAMRGQDTPLSYEGTRDEDGTIEADFDNTWTEGEGSVRVYGSWTAEPQE